MTALKNPILQDFPDEWNLKGDSQTAHHGMTLWCRVQMHRYCCHGLVFPAWFCTCANTQNAHNSHENLVSQTNLSLIKLMQFHLTADGKNFNVNDLRSFAMLLKQ